MEKQQLATQHAELVAEANAIGARLRETGFAQSAKKKGATDADVVAALGPVTARAVLEWFASPPGRKTVARLRALGIDPRGGAAAASGEARFAGKTFVLTGTLESLSRSAAGEKIRALGGNVSGSVSGKTSFVVAGPGAGSKLDEARALGVEVLDEPQFLKLLG